MKIRKEVNIEQQEEVLFIASIADALSHPVRVALYSYVSNNNQIRNDICNKDLVAHFDYSQSSLSQHVKKLKEANLFTVKYQDKYSFYSINKTTMEKYLSLLTKL